MVDNFSPLIKNVNLHNQYLNKLQKNKHRTSTASYIRVKLLIDKEQGKNIENSKRKITHHIQGNHNIINNLLLIRMNEIKKEAE